MRWWKPIQTVSTKTVNHARR